MNKPATVKIEPKSFYEWVEELHGEDILQKVKTRQQANPNEDLLKSLDIVILSQPQVIRDAMSHARRAAEPFNSDPRFVVSPEERAEEEAELLALAQKSGT